MVNKETDTSSVSTRIPNGVEVENVVPDPVTPELVIGELDFMGRGETTKSEEKKKGGES